MRSGEKMEKHLLYWVCIAVTLLGISLIVVSFQIGQFYSEIRSIGATLLSVGIIGFIFQYYFQTSLVKQLEAIVSDLKRAVKPNIAKEAAELGIRKILAGRYVFDNLRVGLYQKADNVSWLSTGPCLPPSHDTEREIVKCLERGTNFRFLAWTENYEFQDRVARLMRIKSNNRGPGKIEIRCYEEKPYWYIQIIDNIIYAQPYLHGVHSAKMPMFEVERGLDLYEYFLRHFEHLWNKKSKPADRF